jgi:hypothetical protein
VDFLSTRHTHTQYGMRSSDMIMISVLRRMVRTDMLTKDGPIEDGFLGCGSVCL